MSLRNKQPHWRLSSSSPQLHETPVSLSCPQWRFMEAWQICWRQQPWMTGVRRTKVVLRWDWIVGKPSSSRDTSGCRRFGRTWKPTRGTRRTGERNTYGRCVFSNGKLEFLADPAPKARWNFPTPFGKQEVVELPLAEPDATRGFARSQHARAIRRGREWALSAEVCDGCDRPPWRGNSPRNRTWTGYLRHH